MKPILLSALLLLLLVSFVGKRETLFNTTSNTTLPVTLNKAAILGMVNKVRQTGCQCGDTYYYPVPALNWNAQLEAAAFNHSADMYKNEYFSHTAPDGSRGGDRLERAGYRWMAFGENIAAGYKTEREVVEGWLKSSGHCKNIMNKRFKEMGVARVGNYWTQAFGAR